MKKKNQCPERIAIVTLGCARNLVDSQGLAQRFKDKGCSLVDLKDADTVVVNTCAFVADARQESVDTVLDLIELKKEGRIKKIIVAGCLGQRYGEDLLPEFKDIDAVMGVPRLLKDETGSPASLLTPKHYAYVKVCESCYHRCSFCAIPMIKGKFRSRTIEAVLEEVQQLDRSGVKEINLIGQDITAYGIDLYGKMSLPDLLRHILQALKGIEHVRLLYAFPSHVTDDLLEVMASSPKVCQYLDVPLQHINDQVLSLMNRRQTAAQTRALIKRIRRVLPRAALRTSFIVGFPGEGKEAFRELLDFVEEVRFERMGAFVYSREEGTPAYDLPRQVSAAVKKRRFDRIMRLQQEISEQKLQRQVGQELKVMIDEAHPDAPGVFLGRTEYDAPEVDGQVYVHSAKKLSPGQLVRVKITDSLAYDLIGDVI